MRGRGDWALAKGSELGLRVWSSWGIMDASALHKVIPRQIAKHMGGASISDRHHPESVFGEKLGFKKTLANEEIRAVRRRGKKLMTTAATTATKATAAAPATPTTAAAATASSEHHHYKR